MKDGTHHADAVRKTSARLRIPPAPPNAHTFSSCPLSQPSLYIFPSFIGAQCFTLDDILKGEGFRPSGKGERRLIMFSSLFNF